MNVYIYMIICFIFYFNVLQLLMLLACFIYTIECINRPTFGVRLVYVNRF